MSYRYEVRFIATLTAKEKEEMEKRLFQTVAKEFGVAAEFIEINFIEENY